MANVSGLDAMLRRIGAIEREITKKTGDAVQEITLQVAYDAKRDAPVDLGGLQQSISTEYDGLKLEGKITAGVKYALFVEFGTGGLVQVPAGLESIAAKFKGQGKRVINLPARPFLIPAAVKGAKDLKLKLAIMFR